MTTRIPTDSADAAELREAEAERAAEAAAEDARHATACVDGWLGGEDHPRPCPRCRPGVAGRVACTTCGRTRSMCDAMRRARRDRCCDRCSHGLGGAPW